jgi:hypothetical protein
MIHEAWLKDAIYNIENPKPSFVYFYLAVFGDESDENGYSSAVKIGLSTNWKQREEQLIRQLNKEDNGWPDFMGEGAATNYYLLGLVSGDRSVEASFHRAFKDYALGNEWFDYDIEDVESTIDIILSDYCVCASCLIIDSALVEKMPV